MPVPEEAMEAVRRSRTLCLNVTNPGWDDARGYLLDEESTTLYFPVAKKYLPADPLGYQVLIWGATKVLVTGDLHPATSDADTAAQLALAEAGGMDPSKARLMLLDQRSHRARKTRYKLIVRAAEILRP